ncbi:MAG TPA: isocitrate lyase/phosphoenolpyruvate mutase family protein [Puia sp.]|nr:isocitrate lyase/phosphoenolpyruvate mutase family protein [Puia sp.]
MMDQSEKGDLFRKLHEQPRIFVIPNPWDAGSAKILTSLGFEALATTSAGLAFSLAKSDGTRSVSREETLKNAEMIVKATSLPVSADLENGYGQDPSTCAETILMAAQTGLCGGSIEDTTGDPSNPILPIELSLARVKAAVEAARSLPFHFTLTARAENLLHGRPDLEDTIHRLESYAEAGADVLYAPGLKTKEEILTAVKAVAPKPLNVVMGLNSAFFSLRELEDLGVRRVSVGSTLARVAYGAFLEAAEKIKVTGTFNFAADIVPYSKINGMFK